MNIRIIKSFKSYVHKYAYEASLLLIPRLIKFLTTVTPEVKFIVGRWEQSKSVTNERFNDYGDKEIYRRTNQLKQYKNPPTHTTRHTTTPPQDHWLPAEDVCAAGLACVLLSTRLHGLVGAIKIDSIHSRHKSGSQNLWPNPQFRCRRSRQALNVMDGATNILHTLHFYHLWVSFGWQFACGEDPFIMWPHNGKNIVCQLPFWSSDEKPFKCKCFIYIAANETKKNVLLIFPIVVAGFAWNRCEHRNNKMQTERTVKSSSEWIKNVYVPHKHFHWGFYISPTPPEMMARTNYFSAATCGIYFCVFLTNFIRLSILIIYPLWM